MHNRNFSASAITQRRMEKAIAGSVLSACTVESRTRIRDSSLLYQVRSGQMTQYSKYTGGCIGVSPGCPCAELNQSTVEGGFVPSLPGAVTGIIYTVGSIVVSWNTPLSGTGPFRYVVTPYKNDVAGESVETSQNSYRFTTLEEGEVYYFTVCSKNDFGLGPVVEAPVSMIAPPHQITDALEGTGVIADASPSIRYLISCGLENVLAYAVEKKIGPTRGSRLLYLWAVSMAQAWSWISAEHFVSGVADEWDWNVKASVPLSARDAICWMCAAMDAVTPTLLYDAVQPYRSLFPFSESAIQQVKVTGEWSAWFTAWLAWWSIRQQDGSIEASTKQPTSSANWSKTLIVDGVTVNPISDYPDPQAWTSLLVKGKRQPYLTYYWQTVHSSCLTSSAEEEILSGISPVTGAQRDAEIDDVLAMSGSLTDAQKMAAEFWAGGGTTVSPPLMMAWLWKEYIRSYSHVCSCSTTIYSLLDMGIHLFESGRLVWGLKALYCQDRPIQEIRRRYVGQTVPSFMGAVDGSQWIPYQEASFVTPPFADFPSGHSAFSTSFALVMGKWFGPTIQKETIQYHRLHEMSPLFYTDQQTVYGDFIIPVASSKIQSNVPSNEVTLSFSSWEEMADSARMSRLYGGIHCMSANQGSQLLAERLHSVIQNVWSIPTSATISSPVPSEPAPVAEPYHVPSAPAPVPSEPSPSEPSPSAPVPSAPVPSAPVPSEPSPSEPSPSAPVPSAPVPSAPVPSEPSPSEPSAPVPSEPSPSEPIPSEPSEPVIPYTIQVNYLSLPPSPAIQSLITESIHWIEKLMSKSHGLRLPSVSLNADMVVDVDMQPMVLGILAGARPTVWNTASTPAMPLRQAITFNSNALTSTSLLSPCQFNGKVVVKFIPVMVHEMLHGLGIASLPYTYDIVGWGSFLDATRTWYIGHQGDSVNSKAIQAYQAIVGPSVSRIPVENSFGQGTAYSHWEEGMRDGFVSETRTYNYGSGPVPHFALPNEIMTGVAGSEFYLTPLTAGALMDYGYPVDMSSDAIAPYPVREVQGN